MENDSHALLHDRAPQVLSPSNPAERAPRHTSVLRFQRRQRRLHPYPSQYSLNKARNLYYSNRSQDRSMGLLQKHNSQSKKWYKTRKNKPDMCIPCGTRPFGSTRRIMLFVVLCIDRDKVLSLKRRHKSVSLVTT